MSGWLSVIFGYFRQPNLSFRQKLSMAWLAVRSWHAGRQLVKLTKATVQFGTVRDIQLLARAIREIAQACDSSDVLDVLEAANTLEADAETIVLRRTFSWQNWRR